VLLVSARLDRTEPGEHLLSSVTGPLLADPIAAAGD
jgi:hypothetical protein